MRQSARVFLFVLLGVLALYLVVFVPEAYLLLFVFIHSTCFLWVLAVRLWLRTEYGKGLSRLTDRKELFDWPVRCLAIALIASWLYVMVDGPRAVESAVDRYVGHYESEIVEEFTGNDLIERTIYNTGDSHIDYFLNDYRWVASMALAINCLIQYFGLRVYYRRRRALDSLPSRDDSSF